MSYRDSFDKCPRCTIALTDARSARGCPHCGGLFVDEGVLTEMIREMLPPGPLGRLQLAILEREEPPLGCPSCGERMEQTTLANVPIERCDKHGVWFDRDELGAALYRTSESGAAPMVELPSKRRAPQQPAPPPEPTASGHRELVVRIELPARPVEGIQLEQEIVKIGRLSSCHVRIDDPSVSRMHAVIEVRPDAIQIIDLGSSTGTLVNGERVTRRALQSGDQIGIGDAVLTVTFAG